MQIKTLFPILGALIYSHVALAGMSIDIYTQNGVAANGEGPNQMSNFMIGEDGSIDSGKPIGVDFHQGTTATCYVHGKANVKWPDDTFSARFMLSGDGKPMLQYCGCDPAGFGLICKDHNGLNLACGNEKMQKDTSCFKKK